VVIGKDRQFTFDACFGLESEQEEVFEKCVKNLVLGCFLGFNATVLAYGQTGSGKTFSMGSGQTNGLKERDIGIIPRVIKMLFEETEKRKHKAEFIIKCTFLEIYNEELHDLLDPTAVSGVDRFI
jgi:kinesin family protein 4/21/27